MEETLVNTTTFNPTIEQVISVALDGTELTIGNFETQAIAFEKALEEVEYYFEITNLFNQSSQQYGIKKTKKRNPYFDVDLTHFKDELYFEAQIGGSYNIILENIYLAVDPADVGAEVQLRIVKVSAGTLFGLSDTSVITMDVPDDIAVPTRYFGYLPYHVLNNVSTSNGDKFYIVAVSVTGNPPTFDLILMDNCLSFTVEIN